MTRNWEVVHFALLNYTDVEFTPRDLDALTSLGWQWPSGQMVNYPPFIQRGGPRPR